MVRVPHTAPQCVKYKLDADSKREMCAVRIVRSISIGQCALLLTIRVTIYKPPNTHTHTRSSDECASRSAQGSRELSLCETASVRACLCVRWSCIYVWLRVPCDICRLRCSACSRSHSEVIQFNICCFAWNNGKVRQSSAVCLLPIVVKTWMQQNLQKKNASDGGNRKHK